MWYVWIVIDRRAWSWEEQNAMSYEQITLRNVEAATEEEAEERGIEHVIEYYGQKTIDNERVTVSAGEM